MNKQRLSSWEETLDDAPMNTPLSINAQASKCDDTWGARIETTLLADLSEEERRSLAEHVFTCSACAEHFQQYRMIEEFARELPKYKLRTLSRRSVHASLHLRRNQEKEVKKNKTFVKLVLLLSFVGIAAWGLIALLTVLASRL